jgi:hypothetical protein
MSYDLGSKAQIKRKFKEYLTSNSYENFILHLFPLNLCKILAMLLDNIVNDSLTFIEKDNLNGIYLIKIEYVKFVLQNSKYNFVDKYVKLYEKSIQYKDNLFFSIDKVYVDIDKKYGDRIMLNNDVKNFLNYILVSVQYDITKLSCLCLNLSGKKTLSKELLIDIFKYIINESEIVNKILLKLDSYPDTKEKDDEEEKTED